MSRLTPEKARELLSYDPVTGDLALRGSNLAKQPAGHVINGYRRISLGEFGVHYAHRLAWLLMTGSWPLLPVDHADGDRSNNAWSNLRLATVTQNNANSRRPRNNTTGHKGVTRYRGKFRAQIAHSGRRIWLGDFPTVEGAAAAYVAAAIQHFGQFARAA